MKPTRDGFGEGLVELGKTKKDVVVLSADLTSSTRADWFKKEFPDTTNIYKDLNLKTREIGSRLKTNLRIHTKSK